MIKSEFFNCALCENEIKIGIKTQFVVSKSKRYIFDVIQQDKKAPIKEDNHEYPEKCMETFLCNNCFHQYDEKIRQISYLSIK